MILLGFEIGTGKRVEIPETGHLAWFGQTQLSGKTTALEAIAFRGALRAVAFITKQGEGGFLTGNMIPPYFSEPTNDEEQPLWLWVKSILEANQQRKMAIEESFIIRACEEPRHADTLAEVHSNIQSLLRGEKAERYTGKRKGAKLETKWIRKPATALAASMYTNLNAYFNIVMPQLARLPYTKKLQLGPGLNVMDLRDYAMQTQALVIRSVAEWIYQREKGMRMIIPEVQDFIPQGKNSPVKMAAETFIRKGAANGNFMWFDSQDMAAVDKVALRACSVVGIGVQTEMNEIDRSLASMFQPGLKPINIASLKIGEFFVRTSEARVQKCYVQPAWMDSELHAQAIAKGEESVSSARQMLRAFKNAREKTEPSSPASVLNAGTTAGKPSPSPPQLLQIQTLERDENENPPDKNTTNSGDGSRDGSPEKSSGNEAVLGAPVRAAGKNQSPATEGDAQIPNEIRPDSENPGGKNEFESEETLNETENPTLQTGHQNSSEAELRRSSDWPNETGNSPSSRSKTDTSFPVREDDEKMWREKYEALEAEHKTLIQAHDALAKRVKQLESTKGARRFLPDPADHIEHGVAVPANGSNEAKETIYRYVIERAKKEPGILELLLKRPELRVKVERQTISVNGDTLRGQLALLIKKGFFDVPKNGNTAFNEVQRLGRKVAKPNVYRELDVLAELGFLTREDSGYQSVNEIKSDIKTS